MKLEHNTSQHTTTITKSADFGINDNDLSHIMGILRSQIYSDKLLAVIREYSTNATDANIEANRADTPICVHLPTVADPYISFRDFGKGLTDDEVTQLYIKYGASTKRDSNDYTGCLGIGCKAGFAYGDNFQVITHHGRISKTWLARIDASQRGTISLVSTTNHHTPVQTGTEVRVSIRRNDIDSCIRKANNLFKYWRVKPTCNLELDNCKWHTETDEWSLLDLSEESWDRRHHHKASVLMGNILYPINTSQVKSNNTIDALLDCSQIVLHAPVGSLNIAANRESLEYTDRTCDSITAMCSNMLADLTLMITKSVKSAPTRLKASMDACVFNDILPNRLNTVITGSAKWRDLPLLTHIKFNNKRVVSHSRNKLWRSGDDAYRNKRDKEVHSMSISPNKFLCVYDDMSITETNATRRVRTLQSNGNWDPKHEYYVIPKSTLDTVTPALTSDDYINLDNVTPLKPNRTTISTSKGTKIKHVRINVCRLMPNTLKSARLSTECEPTIDPTFNKYVYVPLDRFDWDGKPDALEELSNIYQALHNMLGYRPTINGVKKHYVKKLTDEWITLDTFFSVVFEDYSAKTPAVADVLMATSKGKHYSWSHGMLSLINKCNQPAICKLANILLLSCNNDHNEIKQICHAGYYIGAIERSTWIHDQLEECCKQHPLLSAINYLTYYDDDAEAQLINDINKLIA